MGKKKIVRVIVYIAGLIILAFGLMLNVKTGLGVSPLVAVAYYISQLTGGSFPNWTLLVYVLFVMVELLLHRMQKCSHMTYLKDLLQIPLSIVFTRFMNLFGKIIPAFGDGTVSGFFGTILGRLVILILAVFFTGTGACLSLRMRLIPNPGDGVVQAISDFSGRDIGLVKNVFDIGNIAVACVLGLLFSGGIIGVGIGTVVAMLGVGRVIGWLNKQIPFKYFGSITKSM